MNVSTGTIDDGRALLSSTFLEICAKVRNNDPSILPEIGNPFRIRDLSEREDIELADALLENTSVTYLQLDMVNHTKSSAEAMAKYVRTSKHLQRIRCNGLACDDRLCCFLPALQESTSLKELHMVLPLVGGPSSLALENMLAHTQSLRSLTLICPAGQLEDIAVAAARSGLKNNTTLRELTLDVSRVATAVSPILTSLRDHPLLRRLCVRGFVLDLTGLETVLLSNTSKITELEIHRLGGGSPVMGLTHVLQALARRPTLTKLQLDDCSLGHDEARLLRVALCNIPSLHSLVLSCRTLGSAGLAELAPVLYHNTSIKLLDISNSDLNDLMSAELLRDILRSNKTITTLDLSGIHFGQTTGAVEFIADGLGSNSTLLKIDLSYCGLGDGGVSTLAQALGSRNTTLQKLALGNNSITARGVGVLLETMEQNSNHITDLDLQGNRLIGTEGAILLARSLGNNTVENLTRLSVPDCDKGDDGFIALISALEQNTSLLHLDLSYNHSASERAYLALAESLPKIKVLQHVDLSWCTGLASTMPLLLAGLRKNTSLFRFYITNYASFSVSHSPEETARFAGGWMQEMERLGYRNRVLPMIRAPKETLPPLGVWPHALARVETLPDVIFEVLRSKPNLVSSEYMKATEDTGTP
jgi:Ran GTPase-activating protein (RanGAP) involved in mRNA processing and transport